MNLIPKICELLGVEIGEEFEIENDACLHRFTENGLEYKVCDVWSACARLNLILNGTEKIIKLPFEPKDGETYWTVYWKGIVDMPCAVYETWRGDSCDFANKVSGNCFRTQAEAEREKYNIYEKLTGKKWEE